jgi:phage host-nuclease inhibitor protein Gam
MNRTVRQLHGLSGWQFEPLPDIVMSGNFRGAGTIHGMQTNIADSADTRTARYLIGLLSIRHSPPSCTVVGAAVQTVLTDYYADTVESIQTVVCNANALR